MITEKMERSSPGKFIIPEKLTSSVSECIIFFNGRFLDPMGGYTIKGNLIEVKAAKQFDPWDEAYIVYVSSPQKKGK